MRAAPKCESLATKKVKGEAPGAAGRVAARPAATARATTARIRGVVLIASSVAWRAEAGNVVRRIDARRGSL
jgi:hypothetical protein